MLPTGKNHRESSLKTEVLLERGKYYGDTHSKEGAGNRNAGVGLQRQTGQPGRALPEGDLV